MTDQSKPKKSRNNYFAKPRRGVHMWVIYRKLVGEKLYFPRTLNGRVIAYLSKAAAVAELHDTRQYLGAAYLQKVGPIS